MNNELGVTYLIDLSKSVVEPPRQGRNGLTTRYCVTWCPLCGVRCGQERVEWVQEHDGRWMEKRKCSRCKDTYTLPLLPFEIKEAEVIFHAG